MQRPRYVITRYLLVAVMGCAAISAADASGRSAVQRDVEGYAIASCLGDMDQPYLKDQADGWGSVIIQRGKGDLDALTAVAAVVKAELAKGDMPSVRRETEPEVDVPLPVMYCSEIIDKPSVRAAIKKAIKKLTPAYRQPPCKECTP